MDRTFIIKDLTGDDPMLHFAFGRTNALDLCHSYNKKFPHRRYTARIYKED